MTSPPQVKARQKPPTPPAEAAKSASANASQSATQAANDAVSKAASEAASQAASQVASQITGQVASQTSGQKSDLDALANRVAALESAVKALSENAAHPAEGANDQAARLTIAAEALRAAVERGAPYQAELAAVQSLGVTQDATAPLQPFAANGVPTAAALAHELAALTPDLRRASETSSGGSTFLERLEAHAQHLVSITPVDAPAGNEPSAVIARIEVDAAHADIAAALTDIAALPDDGKTARRRLGRQSQGARGGDCGKPADRRRRARELKQAGIAMIRIVLFLIIVGALSLGVAWLADRPGDVVIVWQGLRIKTSLMVLGFGRRRGAGGARC